MNSSSSLEPWSSERGAQKEKMFAMAIALVILGLSMAVIEDIQILKR